MKTPRPKIEKVNFKKVETFLGGLSVGEYKYLQLTMNVVDGIKHLIDNYTLSKQEVIDTFKIKPEKFLGFITGNYNYSLMDIARIQAKCMELEVKRAQERKGEAAINLQVATSPIKKSKTDDKQKSIPKKG